MRSLSASGLAALVAALALLAAGCGGDSGSDTSTTAADTTAGTTQTDTSGATTSGEEGATLRIEVENGAPVGGIQRLTVKKGTDVTVVVKSDVDEEVHIHGYDIPKDVSAGETVSIEFVADITGRFEIELEHSGVQIAELTVEP